MRKENEDALLIVVGIILVLWGAALWFKSVRVQEYAWFAGLLMGWGSLIFAFPILLRD